MKDFKTDFIKIYQTERSAIVLMFINFILSISLLVYTSLAINPDAALVKVGYGDIGGYRDGSWVSLLAFVVLAVVFGFFHNILAIRIFHKRGGGMAKFFLIITTFLILGSILVLSRLLGEG